MNWTGWFLVAAFLAPLVGCVPDKPIRTLKPPKLGMVDFKILEIDSAQVIGKRIEVEGHTDLPDNAEVLIKVLAEPKPGGIAPYITRFTYVRDSKFRESLDIPDDPEFHAEPHQLEISFTPERQTSAIRGIVGENGERLTGEHVHKARSGMITTLQKSRELRLDLGDFDIDTIPLPGNFPPNSAAGAVANVFVDWRDREWDAMVKHTFDSQDPSAEHRLEKCRALFGKIGVVRGAIFGEDVHEDTGNASYTMSLQYTNGAVATEKTVTWSIRKLDGQGRPNINGTWLVDLHSIEGLP